MTLQSAVVLGLAIGVLVSTATDVHPRDAGATPHDRRRADRNPGRAYFTDVVLLNQHGEKMRLYTDLLQGKVVVISSFYGDCSGACPVIMKTLVQLQEVLGDRLGKDVHFVSVTTDPTHDTPPRLKAYADKLGARAGWFFMTGTKQNVDWALSRVGQYVEAKEQHVNVLVVGNERTGLWKKLFGLAPAEQVIRVVEGVVSDGGAAAR